MKPIIAVVERPLLLVAAVAGAPAALSAAFTAYGLPLGEAFQLRDDVLGVFGDPAQTGKPAGGDLREGKRTVLGAQTLEQASAADAATVRRRFGDPALNDAGVGELGAIIERSGALAHVEELIDSLTRAALAALDAAPFTEQAREQAREVLRALADAATARTL